jgi:hypothetical protein
LALLLQSKQYKNTEMLYFKERSLHGFLPLRRHDSTNGFVHPARFSAQENHTAKGQQALAG